MQEAGISSRASHLQVLRLQVTSLQHIRQDMDRRRLKWLSTAMAILITLLIHPMPTLGILRIITAPHHRVLPMFSKVL